MKILSAIKSLFGAKQKNFYPIFSFSTSDDETKENVNLYKRWVYTAISTIATDIAALQWGIFKNDKKISHKYEDLINYDLLEAVATHLLLLGVSVLWKVKLQNNILQLVVLRPDRIYKKEDGSFEYFFNGKSVVLNRDDLIIFKNFNPANPHDELAGFAPVDAGLYAILLDEFSTKWNYQFFKQGAKMGLVLETEKTLPKEILERLKVQFQDAYNGLTNAHKPIVLEGGLKIQTISTSQKDMDFTNLKQIVRDEILSYFKVPKAIVGLGEGNNLNIRYFEKIYAQRTLLPLAKKIAGGFTKDLFVDAEFRFLQVVPTDKDELLKEYQAGVITLNEYRKETGKEPITGGDQVQQVKVKKVSEKIVSKSLGILKENIPGTEERAEQKRLKFVKRADDFEKVFAQRVEKIFEKQKQNVLKEIRSWKSVKKIRKKDLTIYFLDKFQDGLLWLGILSKPVKDFFKSEYKNSLSEFGKNNLFTPEKDDQLNQAVRKYILNLKDQVDTTTLEEIAKITTSGLNQGLGVDQIAKQVSEKFDEWKGKRVALIVRTETTRLSNQANQTAREDIGIEYKKWYTANDERTCPYCSSFNGKIVGINENYASAGDVIVGEKQNLILKNDVVHPPLHPNCRCIIVPVVN